MKTKEILFRAPENLASEIRATFSAHTRGGNGIQIAKSCASYVHRLIRREHFSASELREIEGLINSEPDSTTGKVLGGARTIAWIEASLNPS